jgi:GNAT superfamily N-acetyltransferase
MPAIMDDPSAPTIYRVSGAPPYPDPNKPALPTNIRPRQVTLRDRQTIATVVPFVSREQVPVSLLRYLSDQFAKEIEGGDTYPMIDPMPFDKFSAYWLQNFAGVMLLGQINSPDEVVEGKDWSQECLGSFYIKPNYPGRSSHVCNAGFLVTDGARNRGVGRLMGETYLDWAPKLGYTYSVFNLVYETNVASCKIWDALGFKRIGRVKGCGNLKSYPDRLVDAIIYGRDLGLNAEEGGGASDPLLVSEERFDKIKFYLKYGRYPNGSDRAEKSRLRSAATHYKLLDNDVLMLKGKEVISDPIRQMAVARRTHEEGGHAGINKTTSVIAEKYHWSRIKETVSDVIRTCDQCKDQGKNPTVQNQNQNQNQTQTQPQAFGSVPRRFHDVNETRNIPDSAADLLAPQAAPIHEHHSVGAPSRILDLHHSMHEAPSHHELPSHLVTNSNPYAHASDITSLLNPPFQTQSSPGLHASTHHLMLHEGPHHASAAATLASLHDAEMYHPIDPQIISQPVHSHSHHHQQHPTNAFNSFHTRITVSHHHHHHHHPTSPHITHSSLSAHDLEYSPHDSHATLPSHALHGDSAQEHDDTDSFQALLNDPDPDADTTLTPLHHHHDHDHHHHHHDNAHRHHIHATTTNLPAHTPPNQDDDQDEDAVDRDMAMLIEHHDSSSPSPTPSAPPSPLRCEMEMEIDDDDDDLGLGTVNPLHHKEEDPGNIDIDRGNRRKDAIGDGSGSRGEDRINGQISPDGDGGPALGPSGGKRSSIYDVVFDASV